MKKHYEIKIDLNKILAYGLVGLGVSAASYVKVGLLWATVNGLFWPAWLGYQLAKRLA